MRLGVAALLVAVCVCRVQQCVCFPNGSVAFSCGSMAPSHPPYTASTSSPPFTLSTSSATYRPGGVITVTVEVKNSSTEFQGFLLQARSRKGSEEVWPVGSFTNISRSLFTALHCNNMQNSTVSQASGVKKKKVQVMWEAPSNSNYRDVYFSATLVQDYTTFWVQMKSRTMTLDSSSAAGVRFMYLLMC
ncbi:putative ferric-chelate reductase 1 isoform X1 [Pseudoliparis swirei]|uniref:putative ferric-chelate reductase 1 isoform X1 n=1 Tax=Pseudoliparis swirei TaxID=2059687 RepID=UPI0024BEEEB9|nr:putative ferric-chelate reductase 1 isoform X1 [Pseudoliparis swirei]